DVTGAVIFVTHDRYFLDHVATVIYELADKRLYSHTGNYGDYIEAKAQRLEMEAATDAKLRNTYRSELKWIRRGAKARTTKQKARIERFEQLSDQISKDKPIGELDVSMATSRLGKKVLEGKSVSKRFDSNIILSNFSFLLKQGDRIAITGPNGVGKSTLMGILAGELEPDSGEIDKGATVRIAHFTQHLPEMNPDQRMIEHIREISNDIEDADGVRVSATQMLERFLFPTSTHGTPIGKLSGGERKRLHLLRLLMEQPNVLLLDEPTNDLDLETLSVLEQFIDTFPGVVVTISHDRFFLDRTSRELWILDGTGEVQKWQGIYSDYLAEEALKKEEVTAPRQEPIREKREQKKKMTLAEKKEWETIESQIESVENQIMDVEEALQQAGADYEKVRLHTEELERLNEQYEQLVERWSYLQEIAEQ
ncbi:MAG TPA: ATP-binding cassette domain-containing protein, partial [Sporosarcina sp.]|nr:ATP-binding cassette domain-containing protein [Sporosarcina sp.]